MTTEEMKAKVEELAKQREGLLNQFNAQNKVLDDLRTNVIRVEGAMGLLNEVLSKDAIVKETK